MSARSPHSKPAFQIRCSREIFTEEEIGILERYGGELERLANGKRLPTTEAQRRFVATARDQCPPESIYEKTWAKYVWRVKWESSNRSVMGDRRTMQNDREEWKRMRSAVWSDVRRRAQGRD